MNKDEYTKKLERRIHNQRVALRENWMITETRMKHRATPLRSMWWDTVKRLIRENKKLKHHDQILELKEQVNMLIDFIPEGWEMPLGWNQIVGQIRGDIKKFKP